MEQIHILYAEDDTEMAQLNIDFLEFKHFKVTHVDNGNAAYDEYIKQKPDIVLLDIRMPGKSGYDVAKLIRKDDEHTPILFLSSLVSKNDVIAGFDIGANDFIRKEFMIEEVEARMRVALRSVVTKKNIEKEFVPDQEFFRLSAQMTFNYATKSVSFENSEIKLPDMEAKLLLLLCQANGRLIPRDHLCELLWERYSPETSAYLNKYISKLRERLTIDSCVQLIVHKKEGVRLVRRK